MNCGNFSITKRESIFSIVIVSVMLIVGFMIHSSIDNSLMLKHQEYNTALRVGEDANMFAYAMKTDIGNAYACGTVRAIDHVTFDEIGGEYSYVKKVKERYTMHTRTVTYTTTVNGKSQTRTRTETYWTWDAVKTWKKHSNTISFLDVEFPYGTIEMLGYNHITTIKESSHVRYKYYGAPTECQAVIYADLRNNTIDNVQTYHNTTIDQVHEAMTSKYELIIFWVLWVVLTVAVVFGFVYIDNKWLEDSKKYKR